MNILVTGGAGYLGSVLVPKLLVRGHRVRVLDVGYFGMGHLRSMLASVGLIREDIRRVISDTGFRDSILEGTDCILHLSAVSNDPSAELVPELTEEVNVKATQSLAEGARERGIKFIFSSSCSVYGQIEGEASEDSPLNPQTVYAVSKVKAERILDQLATGAWQPVILRNGTLFGYSARMRFDLVVNIFSLYSALYNEIRVFSGGTQWRPFLHVADCARAFIYFAEKSSAAHRYYNVAHENLQVKDLIAVFQRINPQLQVNELSGSDQDSRDYRVSAKRLCEEGFISRLGVDFGAEEIVDAIVSGLIQDPESIYYRNVKWLKELTQIGSKGPKEVVAFMETLSKIRSLHY